MKLFLDSKIIRINSSEIHNNRQTRPRPLPPGSCLASHDVTPVLYRAMRSPIGWIASALPTPTRTHSRSSSLPFSTHSPPLSLRETARIIKSQTTIVPKSIPRCLNVCRSVITMNVPKPNLNTSNQKPIGILTVCLGNICRSPTAEAIIQKIINSKGLHDRCWVDSCGTGGGNPDWYVDNGWSYHQGDPADPRMTRAAAARGIHITSHSRPLVREDLERFDMIVGMDQGNLAAIRQAAAYWGKAYRELADRKVHLVTDFCRRRKGVQSVPDPYYGGATDFERVIDLLEDACEGLVEHLFANERVNG